MNVLEKILEEIKEVEKEYVTGHKVLYALGATGMATEISNIIRSNMENYKMNELDKKPVWELDIIHHESYDLGRNIGWNECLEAIQMNRDENWIPCSERMPNEDMDNHPVWITYGSCGNLSTKIAYCEWVLSQDENGDDDSYNRFRIEQSPEAYYPSANLVHAWKPVKIPEPYRAADSKQDWKEHILNTFLAGH